jgi:putative hydrolase of the HAD superfamily
VRIGSVVFDVDGVLVYTGSFGRRLTREHGVSPAELQEFFHGPFRRCMQGEADLRDELAPHLERWSWPGSPETFLAAWFEADSRCDPALLSEVARLREAGIRCHLASNQEPLRAAYLEGPMGFGQLFDATFFSCRLGVRKPHAAFYRRVRAALGVPADSLLFLDDQQKNVDAARKAGWRAELHCVGDEVLPLLRRYGLTDDARRADPGGLTAS